MSDYIPTREADQAVWLANFGLFVVNNGAAFGLTAQQITDFSDAITAYSSAIGTVEVKEAEYHAAVADKNAAKAIALELARALAQLFQNHPAMTDGLRATAGLTIPDPTPSPSPDISMLEPPIVLLDFSRRNQVMVHWGTNPGNEKQNAKPPGVMGARIEWARGGIPTNEASWVVLDSDSQSPYLATFNESVSIKLAFRARWIGKNLKTGPAGDPVTCSLTI